MSETPREPACTDCKHPTARHDAETGECVDCRREWFSDYAAGHPGVCFKVPEANSPPPPPCEDWRDSVLPVRSAYAFPIYACEKCWHGESALSMHTKVIEACPKCGGTMREVGTPVTDAPQPCNLLCLVCAHSRPWGIWDSVSGVAVCIECRDKARRPADSSPPPAPSPTTTPPREVCSQNVTAMAGANLPHTTLRTFRRVSAVLLLLATIAGTYVILTWP